MALDWLNRAGAKLKSNWDASRERAKELALKEKAYRDEAKALYQGELELAKRKAIKDLAIKKAKLDAKLQAQKMFAPKQQSPLLAPNPFMNGILGGAPRKDNLKKDLKKKLKKGSNSNFDDLIWKY
jgi:hypothetical protein